MNVTLRGGARSGCVRIPASKSQAHRLLICAALGDRPVSVLCDGMNADIHATIRCLEALGASVRPHEGNALFVTPVSAVPEGERVLNCGESGSTLRFLLPVVGALGAQANFLREGRLPQRPLAPLDRELACHGMTLCEDGAALHVSGRLTGGDYVIPGNVSSQYISALLFALPMLPVNSTLRVTGILESAPYVAMTEEVLRKAGIRLEKEKQTYLIPGGQCFALPDRVTVEGDWSSAAFFLCMGALSTQGVRVEGLAPNSAQGDRAILSLLRDFGAIVEEQDGAVIVRRGEALHPCVIDAAATPDLVPALSALAATVPGETRIENAARLRLKESDRLRTTDAMLTALGASVRELPDGLVIRGGALHGGTVRAENDHRIAMAAAVAACAAEGEVTVLNAECTEKSYPAFWTDFAQLTML